MDDSCSLCCSPSEIYDKGTACGRPVRECCLLPDFVPLPKEKPEITIFDFQLNGTIWERTLRSEIRNHIWEEENEAKIDDRSSRFINRTFIFDELLAWLDEKNERQKVFVNLDVWAIKDICFQDNKQKNAFWIAPGLKQRDLGLEVAAELGGICGKGVSLPSTQVSTSKTYAVLPNFFGKERHESWVFDAYSLSLMEGGERPRGCLERAGVALLLGQISSNIWHFAQDAVWLWKLLHTHNLLK